MSLPPTPQGIGGQLHVSPLVLKPSLRIPRAPRGLAVDKIFILSCPMRNSGSCQAGRGDRFCNYQRAVNISL